MTMAGATFRSLAFFSFSFRFLIVFLDSLSVFFTKRSPGSQRAAAGVAAVHGDGRRHLPVAGLLQLQLEVLDGLPGQLELFLHGWPPGGISSCCRWSDPRASTSARPS